MFKKRSVVLFCLVLVLVFGGMGTVRADSGKTRFTLGCMPLNLPTVELIKEFLPSPYEMEIMVFDANHLPQWHSRAGILIH